MANGRWQNAQVFSIFHLPSAIQDAFFSILLAAAGLVAIMIGAVATHVRRKEPPAPPIVLGIVAAIVAVGRFAMAP
jgi:DoxX-like family